MHSVMWFSLRFVAQQNLLIFLFNLRAKVVQWVVNFRAGVVRGNFTLEFFFPKAPLVSAGVLGPIMFSNAPVLRLASIGPRVAGLTVSADGAWAKMFTAGGRMV